MTDKRILILENGQVTIGGVEYVLVPKAADTKLLFRMRDQHWKSSGCQFTLSDYAEAHTAMLSAAATNLSGLPRVPEQVTPGDGWDLGWNDALDAIGVPK